MTRRIVRIIALLCCMALMYSNAYAQALPDKPRPSIALVLEGGGALGLAHIGVIKVLEELGIPIDMVVGTSMGAIVGGFYAQGLDAASLEKVALSVDWTDILMERVNSSEERFRSRIDRSHYFFSIDFDSRGFKLPGSLLSGRKLLYFLDRSTISIPNPVDFDSLPRRYRGVSADLDTGERVVIDHGSLADVMRASMGIPGVLAPHLIGKQYLVDGGMVDNLPISTARELGADLIIAVDLLGGIPFAPEEFERNPIDALFRTMEIMIRSNVIKQLPGADLVLTVDLSGYLTTDFKDAAEIMKRGEDTARSQLSELESFRLRLGGNAPGKAAISPVRQSAIQRVTIMGGNQKDRARAYILFAPFIGTIPDEHLLEEVISILEALGVYEYIRVRRTNEGLVPTMAVTLNKRTKAGHSMHLGIEYASTYSASTESSLSLSPGIVLRGLTTDDSRLAVNIRILDSPDFEASFVQPLSAYWFAELLIDASHESRSYADDSAISFLHETNTLDLGVNIGLNPVKWMELSLGLSYQWMESEHLADIIAGDGIASALMGHGFFSMRRFDSPVFPIEGIGFKLRYDVALPGAWATRSFHTIKSEGIFIPRLNIPFSFAMWGKAGSDFSAYADGATAAPQNHKLELRNRQFFPGPLKASECIGSHIAGIGGELKFLLPWATQTIGLPSFLIAQIATGSVLQDIADIGRIGAFSHWNAALGLGIRINDGFGMSIRIGALRGFDSGLRPYLALDLGAIGF